MNEFNQVIENLEFLKEDPLVIKKVKETANQIISILKQQDIEFNVEKALQHLDELNSSEIPSYDRTQLWNIVSMLECITSNGP